MKALAVGERILLTLWAGSTWTVGYLAAPTLFATLDDRRLAGELAGKMFAIVGWLSLVCIAVLLVAALMRGAAAARKQWRTWILVGAAACVATSLFVIQPKMQALKAEGLAPGSEAAAAFGRMHGVSSGVYLLTSLFALALVAAGLRGREERLAAGD